MPSYHWNVTEERAAAHNVAVDRSKWTLAGPFHIGETEAEAYRQVEGGQWTASMRLVMRSALGSRRSSAGSICSA